VDEPRAPNADTPETIVRPPYGPDNSVLQYEWGPGPARLTALAIPPTPGLWFHEISLRRWFLVV